VDINYAIRWLKARAAQLQTRPDIVGIVGASSGGHLAMLAAMRPNDPRYAAIPLPAGAEAHDATVRCVVLSWPVINPFSRYRLAKREQAKANPPEWPKGIIARHDSYWRGEANMAEGNPMLALERGEKVLTPPAVWFQGRGDILHDYKDEEGSFPGNEPQRFVANYRKSGGEITLEYIDAERHAGHAPDLSKIGDMFERMVAFVGNHTSARTEKMPTDRTRRTMTSLDAAEAAFKAATTKPAEPAPKRPSLPGAKEQVSLRIDRDVLDYFQELGPGWQDRINDALRRAAGK
jgi:acetyl esterase